MRLCSQHRCLGQEGERQARGAQRRDLREDDEDVRLGLLEHGESTGVEAVAQVDDDMVERRPQHGEGTIDVIDGDPRVDVGVRRCGEHPHA